MSSTNNSPVSNIKEALDWLFNKLQTLMANDIKQAAIMGSNGEEINVEEALCSQKEKIESVQRETTMLSENFGMPRFINPLFQIHQQYDVDASIATNPVNRYVFDLSLCNGTGSIKPHSRGHGAVVTGTINIKRYISPEDWLSYPDKINLCYSIDGAIVTEIKEKSGIPVTSDGWALIINRNFTNCTIDWINFVPVRPVVNYSEDLRICRYYYIGNEIAYGNGLINTGSVSQPGRFTVKLDKMRLALSAATKGAIPSSGHAIITSGGWNAQVRNVQLYNDIIAGEFYSYSGQATGWLGIFNFKTPTIDANYYSTGV